MDQPIDFQTRQFPLNACMAVDDGFVCKLKRGHSGNHFATSLSTGHEWARPDNLMNGNLLVCVKGPICPICGGRELCAMSPLVAGEPSELGCETCKKIFPVIVGGYIESAKPCA